MRKVRKTLRLKHEAHRSQREILASTCQEAAIDANDGQRPYQYSQFCDLYNGWRAKLDMPMRQVHRAGEKAFIDYSGRKPTIVDAATGEAIEVPAGEILLEALPGALRFQFDPRQVLVNGFIHFGLQAGHKHLST